MRVSFVFSLLLGSALPPLHAVLHPDQVGVIDWNQRHLGRVSHAFAIDSQSLMTMSADKNLFAALSKTDGSIRWRQIMPTDTRLRHVYYDEGIVVSVSIRRATGLLLVHGWSAATGGLLWERLLDQGKGVKAGDGKRFFPSTQTGELQLCSIQPGDGRISQCRSIDSGIAHSDDNSPQAVEAVKFEGKSFAFHLKNSQLTVQVADKTFSIKLSSGEDDSTALYGAHVLRSDLYLIVLEGLTVYLIDEQKVLWTRHEALAYPTAVQFVQLPEPFQLRQHFIPAAGQTLWDLFRGRWTQHLLALRDALLSALGQSKPPIAAAAAVKTTADSNGLLRDKFGIRQLIIVGTEAGSLFAIVSDSGRVVWKRQMINTGGQIASIVASHAVYSQTPPSLIVTAVTLAAKTHLWTINPLTGKDIKPARVLAGRYQSAARLPVEDQQGNHAVLLSDSESDSLEITSAAVDMLGNGSTSNPSIVVHSVHQKSGLLEGSAVTIASEEQIKKIRLWSLQLPAEEQIIAWTTEKIDVSVASIGRVLGDRSVMYKYLNPNMIVVATENRKQQWLTIYFVDLTSGAILHRSRQEDYLSGPPVSLLARENWLVYTYWADQVRERKAQSTVPVQRVVIMELYQAPVPDVKLSSPDQLPFVQSQAYSVAGAIKALGVTTTLASVTTREVLLLTTSNQIHAISRRLLDPRRPMKAASAMSAEEKEEELIPYQPVLELNPKETITYGLNISVDTVMSVPTALESTTLILAYGLDLFLTRKLPSKGFDFLDDSFSRSTISLLISGLAVGIVVCRDLAAKRKLKRDWS